MPGSRPSGRDSYLPTYRLTRRYRVADPWRTVHDRNAWMTDALGERTVRATTEDPMDHDSGVITHPKFRIWLRPDGIVQLVWGPRTTVLLEDATAALEAMAQLTGGRRSPPLVYMRAPGPRDRPTP